MDCFIKALINDKESNYYNKSPIQVVEAIINENVSFAIDENNIITEKKANDTAIEVFTKDWKNENAIYALKILLEEFPKEDNKEDEETEEIQSENKES
jgi:hypothetical protein